MPLFRSAPQDVTVRVVRRTSLEELADQLIAGLKAEFAAQTASGPGEGAEPAMGLFYSPEVIVPNKAMRRYLTMRFARAEGVAAGIRFPSLMSLFPSERIDEKSIGWRIYRILQSDSGQTAFPRLARWGGKDPKRSFDLANQLGRLYYQYMLYRPDWLNAWEGNAVPDDLRGVKDADWQGELWRQAAGNDWKGHHFASEYARIIQGTPGCRHRRIRIFGFSQLAPAVMECLAWFNSAGGAEVTLYQLVPSRGKYFDEENRDSKAELKELVHLFFHTDEDPKRLDYLMSNLYFQHNPLIASLGMQSRVMMTEAETLQFLGTDDEEIPADETYGENDTVLRKLQRRVLNDEPGVPVPAKALASQADACPSIQIRSCYSLFREVEAAHNFILHCLDGDPGLSLNNIFIMTPKPDVFSPLVDAVFNHSEGGILPVSIADRPRTAELQSYRTFLRILSLFKGQFSASDVFGILQDASVQTQLGVTGDECREFRELAMRAGIRWGWDADEHGKENSGGRAFSQNTWQSGFDRMILHYAMDIGPAAPFPAENPGEADPGDGRHPVFAVPGYSGSRAVTLGKIAVMIRRMHDFARLMRTRAATGVAFRVWKETLLHAAADFFGAESDLSVLLLEILTAWGDVLSRAQERTGDEAAEEADKPTGYEADDTPLTSDIVLAYLKSQVSGGGDSTRGFLRGSITFCGLRPMRSIPADVIVLLGMDHRSFPGDDNVPEFDLMRPDSDRSASGGRRRTRRVGDPDKREESRQLFLDVLMAARKYLYISYVGRDNHDRKEYPPSVCVEILRLYLEQEFGRNSFVDIQEPVQAFSPALFTPGCRNQSYSKQLLDAARKIRTGRAQDTVPLFPLSEVPQAPDESLMHLSLDDLYRFLKNPAEEFLRNRLDASVSVSGETPTEDSEPFPREDMKRGSPGRPGTRQKQELFDLYLRTAPEKRGALARISLERMKSDGMMPLTQTTEQWPMWDKIAAAADYFEAETGAMTKTVIPRAEKTFACGVTLLLPEQEAFSPGGDELIQVIPCITDDLYADQMIQAILMHLGANLRGKTVTRILHVDSKGRKRCEADSMSCDKAETALNGILELYREGMTRPLPFFPRTIYDMFCGKNYESAWNGSYTVDGEVVTFGMFFGRDLPAREELVRMMRIVFGNDTFLFTERSDAQ